MNRKAVIWISLGILLLLIYGLLNPETFPFPQCPFLLFTGFECPGCGSQRALHHFLHGNFQAAFTLNYLFFPALIYVLVGFILIVFFPSLWLRMKQRWYGRRAAMLILVVILVYWVARNL